MLLAAIEHKFWDNFCRAVSRQDLLDVQNKTFAVDFADGGKADLLDELVPVFRSRTEAEWMTSPGCTTSRCARRTRRATR